MAYELVIQRIEDRRKALGLSERKMLVRAAVGEKSLYHLKQGRAPKPGTLAKLATALGLPPAFLLEAAGTAAPQPDLQPQGAMETVFIRGAVQAGVWRPALEWEPSEWYAGHVPASRKYPGYERFGLEVRGNSMNQHYPDGSVVLCISFYSLSRAPMPGDHLVVLKRDSRTDDFEATLKEYQIDEQGRHILWPRSTDPEFQTPIILPTNEIQIGSETDKTPAAVNAGHLHTPAGIESVTISALVVGMYREN